MGPVTGSTDGGSNELDVPTKRCTIEASVVTGFEECARGEAREKFSTDVKAARGKITWDVPFDQVENVRFSIFFLLDMSLIIA